MSTRKTQRQLASRRFRGAAVKPPAREQKVGGSNPPALFLGGRVWGLPFAGPSWPCQGLGLTLPGPRWASPGARARHAGQGRPWGMACLAWLNYLLAVAAFRVPTRMVGLPRLVRSSSDSGELPYFACDMRASWGSCHSGVQSVSRTLRTTCPRRGSGPRGSRQHLGIGVVKNNQKRGSFSGPRFGGQAMVTALCSIQAQPCESLAETVCEVPSERRVRWQTAAPPQTLWRQGRLMRPLRR